MKTIKVASINELRVLDLPAQSADVDMNGRRITIYLKYNTGAMKTENGFWTIDLYEDEKPLLVGRKLVLGIDLLQRYNLGLGKIICTHVTSKINRQEPNRQNLPARDVRLHFAWDEYVPVD